MAQLGRICPQSGRPGFHPWVRKIPWRREWQPAPVFLPRKFHGQRSQAGYSPWGHKESDITEQLTLSPSGESGGCGEASRPRVWMGAGARGRGEPLNRTPKWGWTFPLDSWCPAAGLDGGRPLPGCCYSAPRLRPCSG